MEINPWNIYEVVYWLICGKGFKWLITFGVISTAVAAALSIQDAMTFHVVSTPQTLKCEIKDLERKDFFGEKKYRFICESSEIIFRDEHSSGVRFNDGDIIEITYTLVEKVEISKTSADLAKPDKIYIVSDDLGKLKIIKWGDVPDTSIRNIKVTKI